MKKLSSNTGLIHTKCANDRTAKWQKDNAGKTIKVGDNCKMEFKDDYGNSEHMWVEVTKITSHSFQGKLNNDPIRITDIKYGGAVVFPFTSIEQHIPKE